MKILAIHQIQEIRRRLDALRGVISPRSWQRADSLLRRAALTLSLSEAEWNELSRLLPSGDGFISEPRGEDYAAQKRRQPHDDDDALRMAFAEILRRDAERPGRIARERDASRSHSQK